MSKVLRLRPTRRSLLLSGGALLAAAAAWAGAYKVGPGEVALTRARDGGVAAVYGPGWHWRLPLTPAPLRLPHTAVPFATELELPASPQPLVVAISGRFAVETGREETWARAAGWSPFLDGVLTVLRAGLADEARALPVDGLFGGETALALRRRAESVLGAAGAQVQQLQLHVPAERNEKAA